MILSRMLEHRGVSDAPSMVELTWLENRVAAGAIEPAKTRWRLGDPAVRAATLAMAAVSIAVVAVVFRSWDANEFADRKATESPLRVRALCASRSRDGAMDIRSVSPIPGPHEVRDCPRSGTVMFAAATNEGGSLYVLYSVDDSTFGWPPHSTGQGIRVERSRTMSPLPVRIPLGAVSKSELVAVILLSRDPKEPDAIRRTLERSHDPERWAEELEAWIQVRRIPVSTPSTAGARP